MELSRRHFHNVLAMFQGGILVVNEESSMLDREVNDRVLLKVVATDSGSPPLKVTKRYEVATSTVLTRSIVFLQTSVDVTIFLEDINDNPPVLSSAVYHGTVYEDNDHPVTQSVTMVRFEDD